MPTLVLSRERAKAFADGVEHVRQRIEAERKAINTSRYRRRQMPGSEVAKLTAPLLAQEEAMILCRRVLTGEVTIKIESGAIESTE